MKNLIASLLMLTHIPYLYSQMIDGGNQHTIVLTKDGTVWTMGSNEYGELGIVGLELGT
jgi:alpha-tubulin suppressor-like RCC1 family protein